MLRILARVALGVLLVAMALVAAPARALAAYSPPPLAGAVTDTAGALSKADRARIESRLGEYRTRTTNEVVVFVLDALGGESVEDVAYAAFRGWGVGKKGKDNGVLLVVAMADRRMRIETGKGIGDKLTDIESSRILRERLGPFLKVKRTAEGIEAALDAIEAALDGRPAPPIPDPNAPRGAAASASEPDPDTALGAQILAGRKLPPGRRRIFDRTGSFSADDLAVANHLIQGEWRAWNGVAVVLVPSSAAFTEVAATTVRREVGGWPLVVQVGLGDRKANVSIPPDFGEARKAAVLTQLRTLLAPPVALDLERVRQIGPMVDAIAKAPPPAGPSASGAGGSGLVVILTILVAVAVIGLLLWALFRRRSGARGASSAGDSSWSPSGADTSSTFGSDYSSGDSGGGGSDYSGGGGDSGGGGASDSW